MLDIYKDQWIVEQRHRDLKQTLHVRPIFLHNDDRIQALIAVVGIALLVYGLFEADLRAALGPDTPLPWASSPSTATPSPPPAPCSPPSPTYTPPTPAVGSSSTGSPPSNDSSSPTSTSPYHGPKHTAPQQHPKPQTLTPNYAENGASNDGAIGVTRSVISAVRLSISAVSSRKRRAEILDAQVMRHHIASSGAGLTERPFVARSQPSRTTSHRLSGEDIKGQVVCPVLLAHPRRKPGGSSRGGRAAE